MTELIGFGSGKIIDSNSQPRQQRNPIDIVLFKKEYTKLDFGGGINGFLAESVSATIEVKSILTQQELNTAFDSIRNTKALPRNIQTRFMTGYQAPGILSVVIAYDGPTNISIVQRWITQYVANNINQYPIMPPTSAAKNRVQSPMADLIIVLGIGFIQFDNSPISFVQDTARQATPTAKWFVADNANGNLLMLFSQMTVALSGVSASWLIIGPYLTNFIQNNSRFVP